ncbi:MAG TPA: hypothetical protein VMW76_09595 [Bacteroidales bacterium]|nr:hypothetical protein [Bacteroidales bacterium]
MMKLLCNSLLLLVFAAICNSTVAQGKDIQKSFKWQYNVNNDANVVFENYDCDLVIHTWDKGEVEYIMTVDISMKSAEDASYLSNYIEDLEFTSSEGSVTIMNRFWRSRVNIMGIKTIDLIAGKKLRYNDFNMKGELWVPADCNLQLRSKYSRIDLEGIKGPLDLDLYNDKIYGVECGDKVRIAAKYSTVELKDLHEVTVNLYNTDLYAGNLGNLSGESKYSKIYGNDAGRIEINSYNDKYTFESTTDVKFEAKYSDFISGKSSDIDMDCYECTVTIDDVEDIEIASKYTKYQFGKAGNCTISSSYNDKINTSLLNTLNVAQSKYGNYTIDELISSLRVDDGYEDKFTVVRSGSYFKGVKVNGKYIDVVLGLPEELDFRFKANIKYADLDINEEALTTRIKVVEGSQLEYDAVKGTEKEGMPLIEITGYEMSLKITALQELPKL